MSSAVLNYIEKNTNLTFSFDNQYKRFSYITFFPIQANSSNDTDEQGKKTFWFQLVATYKSTYQSINELGEISQDNATVKTLYVKFPMQYLLDQKLTADKVRKFFTDNFVGKKFITLPVGEEMPVFEFKNNVRNIVKNCSQVNIDENFDLQVFINEFEKPKTTK
ncbi:hypothetical protein [Campylobacter ureolyticus]|uniref:hypothetical protein n=1 Tax=Campylobacter ureolyticus TaxID=827 RepID=UPI0022B5331F|nr:hypothetical protein [Campylobacter ureolyticus]MCZ6171740.1 hypothetical protein [Campylobacter ureolyticus]